MTRPVTGGKCVFCGETFSKVAMGRHLDKCAQREALIESAKSRKTRLFHISVQGRYAPEYWLHLEAVAGTRLKVLDSFLRGIWLECCGHLSVFTIEGERYLSCVDGDLLPDSGEEKDMNVKVVDVLRTGSRFIHEYDLGTTTELALRVLSEREGKPISKPIQIMARNDPPVLFCSSCSKTATKVCSQCIYTGEGWLCDDCAKDHKCGEDMLLPVANSPRVGMCGYTGDGEWKKA